MVEANKDLFARLEEYCALRNDPVATPGAPRFIKTDNVEKSLLKDLRVGPRLRFGYHRSLVHLYVGNDHYIGLVGFEFEPSWETGLLVDGNAGFTTCILLESGVAPSASTFAVRDVVEAGRMGDHDYDGHARESIELLFPAVRVVQSLGPMDEDAVWRAFLMLCASECMQGGSWIEDNLAHSLIALTGLSIPSMPYSAISRSIFDADPRSLFMALYRCIEATYSHKSSQRLIESLNLDISWQQMAQALEGELGWHPQEAASLNLVLENAKIEDLDALCECLEVEIGRDPVVSAGRAVYSLRNSIVHFRPGTREINSDDIDWNNLCRLMVNVVFDVFVRAYL